MSATTSKFRRAVKPWTTVPVIAGAALTVLLGSSAAFASPGNVGFGFSAPDISGGSGAVTLSGGGAFNPGSSFGHGEGGFICTSTVSAGPLAGCMAGQGTHWKTSALLASTPFKCTATDPGGLKTASTTNDTVALRADFFRAGDGHNKSFTANVIVSTDDIAPDVPGFQNAWIQGVGCGSAAVNFSTDAQ